MKKLIMLIGIVLLASCMNKGQNSDLKTKYVLNSEIIYLKLNHNTTLSELIKISKEFKAQKNIDIKYLMIEFNKNGGLTKLTLDVDCNDGFSGSIYLSKKSLEKNYYGFKRDYSENSKIPFEIGKMSID